MGPCILLAGEPAQLLASGPSLLSLHSPTFVLARSGVDALSLVAHHRPRLAVVSPTLPDMTGSDLVSRIRADRELRRLSMILLGYGEPGPLDLLANSYFDIKDGLDVASVAERGERLLAVQPRVRATASVCLGRQRNERSWGSFAQAVNLSESGMLLTCRERLGVGEDVTLHFVLPRETVLIAAEGRVVRKAAVASAPPSPHGFGVEFTSMAARDQLRLRRFVQEATLAA